jgi:hypothetical protein
MEPRERLHLANVAAKTWTTPPLPYASCTSSHFPNYGFVTSWWDDRGLVVREKTMMKNRWT